jgi:hypothetical protein
LRKTVQRFETILGFWIVKTKSLCTTYCGSIERKSWDANLRDTLLSKPEIKLVIVDTLFEFIDGVKDSNEYVPCKRAMTKFMDVARECEALIVLSHHTKKSESDDARDNVLGSSAILAGSDTAVFLSGSGDEHLISTIQRYGKGMPKTVLIWDDETRSVSLGNTSDSVALSRENRTRSRIDAGIRAYIHEHSGCVKEDALRLVSGNTALKKEVFSALFTEGVLERSGTGRANDPYLYSLIDDPAVDALYNNSRAPVERFECAA